MRSIVTPELNTYRDHAYRAIREKIASGGLTGGSQVSELSLARELGMSRTPVREAIGRLIVEGLVQQIPRHGTIVRSPDRKDMTELYEVREALESHAAAEAARRIGPSDLEELTRHVEQMRQIAKKLRSNGASALHGNVLRQFLEADMAFHNTLIRATGNDRIQKITAEMGVLTRIFGQHRQTHTPGVVARACRFHGRILRAVRRGDAEGARRWMARHLRISKQQSLDALERGDESA